MELEALIHILDHDPSLVARAAVVPEIGRRLPAPAGTETDPLALFALLAEHPAELARRLGQLDHPRALAGLVAVVAVETGYVDYFQIAISHDWAFELARDGKGRQAEMGLHRLDRIDPEEAPLVFAMLEDETRASAAIRALCRDRVPGTAAELARRRRALSTRDLVAGLQALGGDAAARLLRTIWAEDKSSSEIIATALAAIGGDEAIAGLRELLAMDGDWEGMKRVAAEGLYRHAGASAIPDLAACCDVVWRAQAILEKLGAPAVDAVLAALPRAKKPEVILELLETLGDRRAAPAFTAALASPDARVRGAAAHGLLRFGLGDPLPLVIEQLRLATFEASPLVERVIELGERAVPPLIELLGHERPLVRLAAVVALGRLRDARAVIWLHAALRGDREAPVRREAAVALVVLGAAALEALADAFCDPDELVGRLATFASGDQALPGDDACPACTANRLGPRTLLGTENLLRSSGEDPEEVRVCDVCHTRFTVTAGGGFLELWGGRRVGYERRGESWELYLGAGATAWPPGA